MTDFVLSGGARLLSVREAAAVLGISERTIRSLVSRGELPCVRIGRRVLFDPQDLETFIHKQRRTFDGNSR